MGNEHNCVIEEQGFVSPQLQPVDRGTNAHRSKQVPSIAYNEEVEWFEASGARGRTGRGVASTHSNWYQSAESFRMGPSHQGKGSMPAIGYRHEYSISIDLHCLGQGNIPHSMIRYALIDNQEIDVPYNQVSVRGSEDRPGLWRPDRRASNNPMLWNYIIYVDYGAMYVYCHVQHW
jgi:hypothetical protein